MPWPKPSARGFGCMRGAGTVVEMLNAEESLALLCVVATDVRVRFFNSGLSLSTLMSQYCTSIVLALAHAASPPVSPPAVTASDASNRHANVTKRMAWYEAR